MSVGYHSEQLLRTARKLAGAATNGTGGGAVVALGKNITSSSFPGDVASSSALTSATKVVTMAVTNATTNATDPPSSNGYHSFTGSTTIDALVLAWLVVIVGCLAAAVVLPSRFRDGDSDEPELHGNVGSDERQRRRRRTTMRRRRGEDRAARQALIERSLTVKPVTSIDEQGNLTLGKSQASGEDSPSGRERPLPVLEETDVDDFDDSVCVICLNAFEIGDEVAWKRRTKPSRKPADRATVDCSQFSANCNHAWHKECIMEWLINPKHDDCPSCRAVLLPRHNEEEGNDGDDDAECLGNVFDGDGDAESGWFVVMHGMVKSVRRASRSFLGRSKPPSSSVLRKTHLAGGGRKPPRRLSTTGISVVRFDDSTSTVDQERSTCTKHHHRRAISAGPGIPVDGSRERIGPDPLTVPAGSDDEEVGENR